MVLPPMAMVWRCPLSVDEYVAVGKGVEVPRPESPGCGKPMRFRSGYWRHVRSCGGTGRPAWVRRAQCVFCRQGHALLPSLLLEGRLDAVEDIGAVVEAVVAGTSVVERAAKAQDLPYTTARGWLRRFRARAPVLAAGFAALAVAVGAEVGLAALPVGTTGRPLGALRFFLGALGCHRRRCGRSLRSSPVASCWPAPRAHHGRSSAGVVSLLLSLEGSRQEATTWTTTWPRRSPCTAGR